MNVIDVLTQRRSPWKTRGRARAAVVFALVLSALVSPESTAARGSVKILTPGADTCAAFVAATESGDQAKVAGLGG